MATVYCGVDFHARKQTVSYLTIEDGEIKQTELPHELEKVRRFYAKLRQVGQLIVGFERSGYAPWFEEMLEARAVRSGWDMRRRFASVPRGGRRMIGEMLI